MNPFSFIINLFSAIGMSIGGGLLIFFVYFMIAMPLTAAALTFFSYFKMTKVNFIQILQTIASLVIFSYILRIILTTGACSMLSCRLLVTVLTTIWAVRLGFYLSLRQSCNIGHDRNYLLNRQLPSINHLGQLFYFFALQSSILLVIIFPVMLTNLYGCNAADCASFIGGYTLPQPPFFVIPSFLTTLVMVIGTITWLIGFCYEALADKQLFQFVSNPFNAGKILTQGLWYHSRHPNYFGEIVMWSSLWLIALTSNAGSFALVGIMSPLLMSYLLLKVSGVPVVDKELAERTNFVWYYQTTSCIIPRTTKR